MPAVSPFRSLPAAALFSSSRRLALLLSGLLLTASACTDSRDDLTLVHQATVTFNQLSLYPEGVQFDVQNNYFLVSSEARGTLGKVTDQAGYSVFSTDALLISSIGLNVDRPRNRVLVAVSDPGYSARSTAATKGVLARLVILNRDTGVRTYSIDLSNLKGQAGKPHFANDIAVDGAGNAYVTDSFAPVIYKVDPQGNASIFLKDSTRFTAPAGTFGLNGIVFHPGGYLLVGKSDTGVLFKVPIANNVAGTPIAVTVNQDLQGADGLLLQNDTTLLVVANKQSKVFRLGTTLKSANVWSSATLTGTFTTTPDAYPTTLAQRTSAEPYVLYSHLNALQSGQQTADSVYSINKVTF